MKLRKFITRRHFKKIITKRKAKWAGLAVCALLAAVFVSSRWVSISVKGETAAEGDWWVKIAEGQLVVVRVNALKFHDTSGLIGGSPSRSGSAKRQLPVRYEINYQPRLRWWVEWERWPRPVAGSDGSLRLPLWMPLLLVAIPTGWLWRVDRRIQPWQCRGCRYDLRGLEGGGEEAVCPECGLAIGEG